MPNFSGLARTQTVNPFQRSMVILVGLLGPSLLGVLMIFLTRGLNWYRVAIIVLAALLAMSQIWAGDKFTRLALGGWTLVLVLIAWKVPSHILLYISHIIAIALCLNALTGFGYFFVGNADIAGTEYQSDTGVMADILGGPFWLWGALIAALSIVILLSLTSRAAPPSVSPTLSKVGSIRFAFQLRIFHHSPPQSISSKLIKTILNQGISRTLGPSTRLMDVTFGEILNILIRHP